MDGDGIINHTEWMKISPFVDRGMDATLDIEIQSLICYSLLKQWNLYHTEQHTKSLKHYLKSAIQMFTCLTSACNARVNRNCTHKCNTLGVYISFGHIEFEIGCERYVHTFKRYTFTVARAGEANGSHFCTVFCRHTRDVYLRWKKITWKQANKAYNKTHDASMSPIVCMYTCTSVHCNVGESMQTNVDRCIHWYAHTKRTKGPRVIWCYGFWC